MNKILHLFKLLKLKNVYLTLNNCVLQYIENLENYKEQFFFYCKLIKLKKTLFENAGTLFGRSQKSFLKTYKT